MTSMTRKYSAAASHARTAVDKTADVWTEGARTVTGRLPGLPQVDLVPAVERYFELVQRMVDINRRLAVRWAEAAGTLSGVAREKAGSAGDVVREKAEVAGNVARGQAQRAEQAAHEQAGKAEQAEQGAGPPGPPGRTPAGQAGSREGPPALRRPTQGRAERPASQAGATQDGQYRRAHRAPRRGRQQVMSPNPAASTGTEVRTSWWPIRSDSRQGGADLRRADRAHLRRPARARRPRRRRAGARRRSLAGTAAGRAAAWSQPRP